MPNSDDDLFAGQDTGESEIEDLERLREALIARILEVVEEHDITEEGAALLLTEIGISFISTGYVVGTEKPSSSGLKLELDRFGRAVGDLIREMKKGADEFIAAGKEAKAEKPPGEAE
jgi:hypothetical protein